MEKLIRTEQSAHWYYPDGKPMFEIEAKKGGMRSVTVKDARALGLLPSVTTVMSILDKPALSAWKQEQAILASLTLPRLENESDDDFAKRVVVDAQSVSKDAMGLGTRVHASLEIYLNGQSQLDQDAWEYAHPVVVWLESNVDFTKPVKSELRLASAEQGFAGTTDLLCYLKDGRLALIDFKTQGTKEKYNHKISFYDEWCWQLSAYSMIEKADVLINIGISTGKVGVIEVKEWTTEEVVKGINIFKCALQLFKLIKGL
jgi:hypothetical protein